MKLRKRTKKSSSVRCVVGMLIGDDHHITITYTAFAENAVSALWNEVETMEKLVEVKRLI